jgi:membrane protein CcdC involved in cytochrome C biogenesis
MAWMWAASAAGFLGVLAWRVRETRRAVTVRSIVLPPLAMSTGFCMFLLSPFRTPWLWGLAAFLAGYFVLSYPLVRSSVLTRVRDEVVLRGSPAFLLVILVLAVLRLVLRRYVDDVVPPLESAALFFVLAFGMIVRWRIDMLLQYQTLTRDRPRS